MRLAHDGVKPPRQPAHQFRLTDQGARRQTLAGRAKVRPTIDLLVIVAPAGGDIVLRRRQMKGLPAPAPLVSENAKGAKDVTALQWQAVIKDMQDLHEPTPTTAVSTFYNSQ
jgi:hypothetical protein